LRQHRRRGARDDEEDVDELKGRQGKVQFDGSAATGNGWDWPTMELSVCG
jgi:hypothetical protein